MYSKANDVPDVFQEMLAEVESSENDASSETRATKRRRVGERPSRDLSSVHDLEQAQPCEGPQTITLDSEDSDGSDFEWEDVGLASDRIKADDEAAPVDVSVVLDNKQPGHESKAPSGRRSVTSAERTMRLDVHKMHVCCLLYHVFLRNGLCNDHQAQVRYSSWVLDRVNGFRQLF